MGKKIEQFIEGHFVGLLGILMFIFYLIINLLPMFVPRLAKYDLLLLEVIFIVLGTGLLIYDFIPKQVDYIASRFRFWLIQVTDKLTPKSTLVIIFVLTAIGFYIRFNNLGDKPFWFDELITSYASIGLMEHGAPVMPSGLVYNRALLNTYLIAQSFKIFGVTEFSARIVSVIFGTLTIPLVYLLGKELGKRTGLIATLLITFSVFEILWAQQARMYAQFQFFYLLTAYLFYISLKKENSKLFLLSIVSFIFAWYSHRLSLCFIPVAAACILFYKKGEFLKNKYFVYTISGIMVLAFVSMILTSKTPLDYLLEYTTVPKYLDHTCLHYIFSEALSTLFILVAISTTILIILWKFGIYRSRTHFYIILNFFIPFIFLSLYPSSDYRYAFFIFPFLVILASHAIDFYALRNGLNYEMCEQLSNKLKLSRGLLTKVKRSIVLITILLLFVQISSDIYFISQQDYANKLGTYDNWEKAGKFMNEHLDDDDKVATTVPLIILYYVGRVDYMVCQSGCCGYTKSDGVAVDVFTGVIILDNYDLFMQKVNTEKGWLIADHRRLDLYYHDQKVRDYIRNNMTYYPEGSDETFGVYSWGNVGS